MTELAAWFNALAPAWRAVIGVGALLLALWAVKPRERGRCGRA